MDSIAPLEVTLRLVKGDQTSPEPVTLRIPSRNIGIRGHDFEIINEDTGELAFKVKGAPISFHSTQVFYSAGGDKLLEIRYQGGSHPHFEGARTDILEVRNDYNASLYPIFAAYEKTRDNGELTRLTQLYSILPSASKPRVGSGEGPRLILRGDLETEATVVLRATGQVLAVIRPGDAITKDKGKAREGKEDAEETRGRRSPTPKPTFLVTIAPGMDIAAMAGIAVSYNQLHNRDVAANAKDNSDWNNVGSRSRSRKPNGEAEEPRGLHASMGPVV